MDEWEGCIAKSPTLSAYCCVKDLVRHINEETKALYKGTQYQDTYLFYHDALTQMSDSRCVEWMKQEGIYAKWIKPELGCNNEIFANNKHGVLTRNTRYSGRPVGNSPELNPLDNSLLCYFRLNLLLNVATTWQLDKDDERKFSLGKPQDICNAVERLWDPIKGTSPTPSKILQDAKRIPESCF